MRIKIALAYSGANYSGWQIQQKENGPPTIQGVVEAALFLLVGKPIRVHSAGRTDAGVHAHAQVAHFDIDDKGHFPWQRALNAILPADVRIISANEAAPGFHAQKDALAKTYFYDLWQEPAFTPPALSPFIWACGPLDTDKMRAGMASLIGRHDFASFQNVGTPIKSTIREIFDISLSALPGQDFWPTKLPPLRIAICANGFLKQMGRNIAGFLVWLGRGKLAPDQLADILQASDRRALPSPTAPAKGLTLHRIFYESPTIKARG